MNLLRETKEAMVDFGLRPENIIFIGSESSGHSCTWKEFRGLANIEYDNGYGKQEIASDLLIVFSGGEVMYRHEYDGSECWQVHRPFVVPQTLKPIRKLRDTDGRSWDRTLAGINK